MFTRLRLPLLTAFGGLAAGVLLAQTGGAMAQGANGTITGQVLWSNCIRAIPLPAAQDSGQPQPSMPQPGGQPTVTGLPAGAVLVAVQGTAISSRTDEAGHFTLSGVPAGQYLTVAAGPVANAVNAVAERPNVLVSNAGQSVDVGTLSLGGNPGVPIAIACRAIPGPQTSTGAPASPDTTQPTPDTPPDGTPNVN